MTREAGKTQSVEGQVLNKIFKRIWQQDWLMASVMTAKLAAM